MTRPAPASGPAPCPACEGTGQVLSVILAGRRRQLSIEAYALCLDCDGSGTAKPQ